MQDFYSVLRVERKASSAEIKAAFYNLAKTCHPDLKPGDKDAEEAFQEATRAYTFLMNPETRKMYDTFLAEQRAARWERRRRSAMTMSATFVITATIVTVAALMWLNGGGPSFIASRLGGMSPRAVTLEMARALAETPAAQAKVAPEPAPQHQ